MDFAVFWLVIIGPLLFGLAGSIWYGGSKTLALWIGFAGAVLLILAGALQLQQFIWKAPTSQLNGDRPYISVASMGFPDLLIKPGPIIIHWDIENSGRTAATLVDSNMTLFFETDNSPLPEKPQYSPSQHRLTGIEIGPGKVFTATFQAARPLTESDVEHINKGTTRLYVFGFVRFSDKSGVTGCRGFIVFYNPINDPRRGMFTLAEEDHKAYACNEP
ncbi:MAG: hypothetical protein M3178_16830 [Pseudomonadota bacterium]|nr:hypothetical protein [Pseudomonadota bacterium]